MTYSDFINWKQEPVTIAFFEAIRTRIDDCMDILATSAGLDSASDNFNRGFIAAHSESLEFRMEDVE